MHRGYIKIWRKIEDSGLIQLPNALALFMYLMLKATHKDRKMGSPIGVIELKRGQYVSGRKELAAKLKQSEQQIRTSLKRLEDMQILTIKSTNKYSIYTIENYSKYQDVDVNINQQLTINQPADNQQATTKQEFNNLINNNIAGIPTKNSRFEEFWQAWPKSNRKVDKAKCERKWTSQKLDMFADQIILHVMEIKKTKQWIDGYDPAPFTYLNGRRWEVEQETNFESVSLMTGVI